MRSPRARRLAPAALLLSAAVASLAACGDAATAPEAARASAAVQMGERLVGVVVTTPQAQIGVGASVTLKTTLRFHLGGTLSGNGWASWASSDPCVATVKLGVVQGVAAGTALIIAQRNAFADTVKITVTGTTNLDPTCASRYVVGGPTDESNGTPLGRNTVTSGETMTKLVLYAPRAALRVGSTYQLASEMWYNRGGRYDGTKWLSFRSTNPAAASVAPMGGLVTARGVGTTRVIATLGQYADTVLVTVTR
jgi:hypothetical protein